MPRKKKEEEETQIKPGIVNWYEKIPKELLDNAENPNFLLHHLKLPFRMCVVAPSGSGKTNFLINLMNYVHTPYIWGSKDPSVGLDCSGRCSCIETCRDRCVGIHRHEAS